jgi:hypothetical protein
VCPNFGTLAVLRLGRAFGGDSGEPFNLSANDGDAASGAMHKGTTDHADIGLLSSKIKIFRAKSDAGHIVCHLVHGIVVWRHSAP